MERWIQAAPEVLRISVDPFHCNANGTPVLINGQLVKSMGQWTIPDRLQLQYKQVNTLAAWLYVEQCHCAWGP
jgi:hypothetical protein